MDAPGTGWGFKGAVGLFRCSSKTQGQDSLRENRVSTSAQQSCSAQECIWLETGYYV